MTKTLIFDRNAGLLQWVSDLEDEMDALTEFDAAVGIDPNDKGLSTDDWKFYRVSDEKAAAVQEWVDCGSKASEFPL